MRDCCAGCLIVVAIVFTVLATLFLLALLMMGH